MERKSKKCNSLNAHTIIGILVLLLVVLQAVNLYYTMNPVTIPVVQGVTKSQQQNIEKNKALLKKVAKHTEIGPNEEALILTINDVDSLRDESPLNKEVYKDAKNGDRVIGFNDRMIIYNEADDIIVYQGKTPTQIQEDQILSELQPILDKVSKLVKINPQERPRLLTVTDPELLKEKDPEIYEDVEKGDNILIYSNRIIIYRSSTDEIIFDKALQIKQ